MWKEACLPLGVQNEFQRLRKSLFHSLGELLGCGNEWDTWTGGEDADFRKRASFTGSLADEGPT